MANRADARKCDACQRFADSVAANFHEESDVGPWDDACPSCGHICGEARVMGGNCSACAVADDAE